MAKSKGYIRLYRGIFDDKVCKEKFTKHEAWIDLLQLAAYEDSNSISHRGINITIQRGQIALTLDELSERWCWSKKETRNQIDKWIASEQIKRPCKKLPIIELTNYTKYQGHSKSAKKGIQNHSEKGIQNEGLTSEISSTCENEQAKKGIQNHSEKGIQNEQKRAHILKEIYIKENISTTTTIKTAEEIQQENEENLYTSLAAYYENPDIQKSAKKVHEIQPEEIPTLIEQFKESNRIRRNNRPHVSFNDMLAHFENWLNSTAHTRTKQQTPNTKQHGNKQTTKPRKRTEPSGDFSKDLW